MLSPDEFLAAISDAAGSQAEIGRVLGLPSPRISEMYSGKRRLTYEEAVTLAEHYKLDPRSAPLENVTVEQLTAILAACLKLAPPSGWGPADAPQLAKAVQFGLELLATAPPTAASHDATAMAGHAAFLQLRGEHPEA